MINMLEYSHYFIMHWVIWAIKVIMIIIIIIDSPSFLARFQKDSPVFVDSLLAFFLALVAVDR